MKSSMKKRVYLDHNASSPLRPEARKAMLAALDLCGNPSSVHAEGRAARALIDASREEIAALTGAKPAEVVFTCGATEANAWVLGLPWKRRIVLATEHASVLIPAEMAGGPLGILPVHQDGTADVGALRHLLCGAARDGNGTTGTLVSVQMANNETGVLQDIPAISEAVHAAGALLHTDAVQAFGKVAVDFAALGADFLSLSAHKLGGPKGVGALVIREGIELVPLIRGGGQERRRRAGTENLAGIAGFAAAAVAAVHNREETARIATLRARLESGAMAAAPAVRLIGENAPRLPNTSCFALPGRTAEMLVIAFDLAGVALSAGAACSSGKMARSPVLAAMGLEEDLARAAVRVSLGWTTTEDDVDRFLAAWAEIGAGKAAPRRAA